MKYLVDLHADVNTVCKDGLTPLLTACSDRSFDVVKFLVDNRANIDVVDE